MLDIQYPQLFIGTQQLVIVRCQSIVDFLQLRVARLQFIVGTFHLFHECLQRRTSLAQFLFQAFHLLSGCTGNRTTQRTPACGGNVVFRSFMKRDQQIFYFGDGIDDERRFDVDILLVVFLALQVSDGERRIAIERVINQRGHGSFDIAVEHGREIIAGPARRRMQIPVYVAENMQHLAFFVDEHTRRDMPIQQDVVNTIHP